MWISACDVPVYNSRQDSFVFFVICVMLIFVIYWDGCAGIQVTIGLGEFLINETFDVAINQRVGVVVVNQNLFNLL